MTEKTIDQLTDHAVEEAAEVIQALIKCKRFGWENFHPETKVTNKAHVIEELIQLNGLIATIQAKLKYD